jgi:hypothetical protein
MSRQKHPLVRLLLNYNPLSLSKAIERSNGVLAGHDQGKRRDLGHRMRHVARVGPYELPRQPLAVPISTGPGRIEEVASHAHRALQREQLLLVIRACPLAHAPNEVTDLANRPAGPAKH